MENILVLEINKIQFERNLKIKRFLKSLFKKKNMNEVIVKWNEMALNSIVMKAKQKLW
jgi:hypothetical protein